MEPTPNKCGSSRIIKLLGVINRNPWFLLTLTSIVFLGTYYRGTLVPYTITGLSTKECPVTKVGFLKTHKTASSTVQNILLRHSLENDLNIVMPNRPMWTLYDPRKKYKFSRFKAKWVESTKWHPMAKEQGYQVFAVHTTWDHKEVKKLLGSGAIYITVLRDPVDQFESMYHYYNLQKKIYHATFQEFVEKHISTCSEVSNSTQAHPVRPSPFCHNNFRVVCGNLQMGRNQQLYDLGLPPQSLNSLNAVQNKIKQVEKDFDLVLIAEDLDKSFVLMSELLCWPLMKVRSLKKKVRREKKRSKMSEDMRKALRRWLWADQMLYQHFKNILQTKIRNYGVEKLTKKTKELDNMNDALKERCVEKMSSTAKQQNARTYETNDCKNFVRKAKHFVNFLQNLQISRYKNWKIL